MFSKIINFLFSSNRGDNESDIAPEKKPQNLPKTLTVLNKSKNRVSARDLLKQATQLKKDKDYSAACIKLKEAYQASDADDLMIKERLRLPMYLQLAGNNDEGWGLLNELNTKFTDVFSQADIANQMRVFLQKEKKFKEAILYSVWGIAKGIECIKFNINTSIELADQESATDFDFLDCEEENKIYGHTPSGNPITDSSYPMFISRLSEDMSIDSIYLRLEKDMKKVKLVDRTKILSEDFSAYLLENNVYNLRDIRGLVSKNVSDVE